MNIKIFSWIKNNPLKFSVILILLFYFFLFFDPYIGIGGGATHSYLQVSKDNIRYKNLVYINSALELYNDKYSLYPVDLYKLSGLIDDGEIKDPVTNKSYKYAISNNSKDYVIAIQYGLLPDGLKLNYYLKKAGENYVSEKLSNDVDGLVYGINCEDPIYCFRSSK